MQRQDSIDRLRQHASPWDLIVIGGGATGIAVAVDAASRGLDVLLLEQSDFGKGTSSRSTKLVHGGIRYLRQGNIRLVRDALRERTLLHNNAPHLVHIRPFLIPCRNLWQSFFYRVGLKVYDCLATRSHFGRSRGVSASGVMTVVPTLRPEVVRSGVVYYDGQFDDARLLIHMAQTAENHGACLINYMAVTGISTNASGQTAGVVATDGETGEMFSISAKSVVNAAGPFCDAVRRMDDVISEPILVASQGVHLVLPRRFLPGDTAMIVPGTSDGRVLFIIPWHQHTVVGTTDTPIDCASLEPSPQAEEMQFLLDTAAEYLSEPPTVDDVLAVFTGIRPLVKGDKSSHTASLSRDHIIRVSESGLITITGGKWTTVRQMAEDCLDRVVRETGIDASACQTRTLQLHGYRKTTAGGQPSDHSRSCYGTDLQEIESIEAESPELAELLHKSLTIRGSEVVWAVRREMARTVDDVLARRTRCLFLNVQATLTIAAEVARLMAAELGQDEQWCQSQLRDFRTVAEHYIPQCPLPSATTARNPQDASIRH